MANAWVICPYSAEYPDLLQAIWEAGLKQNFISIGWPKVGDATGQSREAIQAIVDRVYSPRMSQGGRSIWTFLNEIQVGDTIVARSNLSHVLGIGRVVRKGFYDPALCMIGADVDPHYLFVGVEWDATFAPRTMPTSRYFTMGTLHRLSPERLAEIQGTVQATPVNLPAAQSGPLLSAQVERMEDNFANSGLEQFALEKYLEAFLVDHFQKIFGNDLVIYRSPDGEEFGQQYDTDIGRIDILAYNRIEKAFVVIELKKGRESDSVVGQVARYMTWVRLNLCTEGQTVRGMIICSDSDARMRHAVMAIPGLELRHYQVDFRFLPVEPAKSTRD
jgi:hypothetical protein